MTNTGLPKKKFLPEGKHGTSRRAKCPACGLSMTIKRREPHPELGPKYELQTFACKWCGQVLKRDAPSPGAG